MNQKISVGNSLKNYISMAKTGHYPLFFEEWLNDLKRDRPISLRSADKNVKDLFSKMAKHQSLERKKTWMASLNSTQREEYIRSFLKIVERDIIKDLKTLQ